MARRRWTPLEDATLRQLHAEGITQREIARRMDRPFATVSEKIAGIAGRRQYKRADARTVEYQTSDWQPPKPPVCTFNAAARTYCAALDRLWNSTPATRAEAAKAVAAALQVMMSEWRAFAATQDGPVPEVVEHV